MARWSWHFLQQSVDQEAAGNQAANAGKRCGQMKELGEQGGGVKAVR
jgi:hypothetical protein